jgi:SH3-like domain-containing protein
MFGRAHLLSTFGRLRTALFLILVAVFGGALAVPAPAAEGPSGLPLPRFATTRSTPINVRIGPGTRYGVAWVYVKAGTPVEIVQEFDTWRKVRDADGSEGWIHQNLLSGKRAGVVAPPTGAEQAVLWANRAADSGVRAYLGPGYRVDIAKCDGAWCEVSASYERPDSGGHASVAGYLPQGELWGVYQNEEFD